jgi:hypothetical protein
MFPTIKKYFIGFSVLILFYSCSNQPSGNVPMIDRFPKLEPDYSGITIPSNIAPLNFMIEEAGSAYVAFFSIGNETQIKVNSGDGKIQISES